MRLTFCPFSFALFTATAIAVTIQRRNQKKKKSLPVCQVVFVLGGPGAGKGTQCELFTQHHTDWAHLSAGDLLRSERQKNTPLASIINEKIAAGQLVPSEVTCALLESGMNEVYEKRGITKFMIDGFPRSQGNVTAWESTMSHHKVEFVLFFECPEEVLTGRLLDRGQTSGRNDDTIDVIRKRFTTYQNETSPIVDMYAKQNKVRRIESDKPVKDVYADVERLFVGL